jgi:hypothetical protein
VPRYGADPVEPDDVVIPAFLLEGLNGIVNPKTKLRREIDEGGGAPELQNSVVRMVAGPFTREVGQIWSGSRLGEYLTATDARRHVWHLWLSSERVSFGRHNPMSTELAHAQLTFGGSKDLIAQATGCQPAGLMRALGRLGPRARPANVYRALAVTLAADGPGATFIRHAEALPDDLILGVATLPPALEAKAVLRLLRKGRLPPHALGSFTWILERLGKLKGAAFAQAILSRPNPLDAIREAVLDLPFPDPPWPGTDCLLPITSREELKRAGDEFENCLRGFHRERQSVLSVINGVEYVYEWRGPEPVLLLFQRIGSIGWFLKEARGRKNAEVSGSTRDRILRCLASTPTLCPVWDLGEEVWQSGGFYQEQVILFGT